ncbi:MAG: MerR family transcriptional regulator [Rhodobacteraceae bacterium]|nr:MerR family transcriptional regulator [Paracoccaceae bacterium]
MAQLFDETQHYQPTHPEIPALLGSIAKQAQMRHYRRGPTFYRLGRKIIYRGADLNEWAVARRVEPANKAHHL